MSPSHSSKTRSALKCTVLGLLMSAAFPSIAGSISYQAGDGNIMKYEFSESATRVSMNEETYFLILDEKTYSVSKADGEWSVLEIGGFMGAIGAAAVDSQDFHSNLDSIKELKKTGRKQKVKGVLGEVYTYFDKQSGEEVEVTLTKDKKIANLSKKMISTFGQIFDNDDRMDEFESPYGDLGVLMWEGSSGVMKLSAYSDDKVKASRFVLPAEPMSIGFDLGSISSGGSKEVRNEPKADGGLEGITDDANELEDALDAVSDLGDSAVKAFGKLFGKD